MKNIRKFLSENFHFLVGKFSVYLNRHGIQRGRQSGISIFRVSVILQIIPVWLK